MPWASRKRTWKAPNCADKWCTSSKPKKPVSVKPFSLEGRLWVNTGGTSHGEHRAWHILPLYTVTEYRAKFGSQPTRLSADIDYDASEADQERQRQEMYTGVLVKHGGETYAIGPHDERRTLTNGKPTPDDSDEPQPKPKRTGKTVRTAKDLRASAEAAGDKQPITRATFLIDLLKGKDVSKPGRALTDAGR